MTNRNRQMLRELLDRIDLGEAMRRRAIQQAISDALPETWRRRAQDFRNAAPRPGDYPGRATLTELAEAGRRCLDTAKACEVHAALLAEGDPWAVYERERDDFLAEFDAQWHVQPAAELEAVR